MMVKQPRTRSRGHRPKTRQPSYQRRVEPPCRDRTQSPRTAARARSRSTTHPWRRYTRAKRTWGTGIRGDAPARTWGPAGRWRCSVSGSTGKRSVRMLLGASSRHMDLFSGALLTPAPPCRTAAQPTRCRRSRGTETCEQDPATRAVAEPVEATAEGRGGRNSRTWRRRQARGWETRTRSNPGRACSGECP